MEVVQLWRFPVKSLGGEMVSSVDVGSCGVVGDRQWGIVDAESGFMLTARRCPRLLFARAELAGPVDVVIRLQDGTEVSDDNSLSDWLGRRVRLVTAAADVRATYETPVDFEQEATSEWVSWQGPEGSFHDSPRTKLSILSVDALGSWDVRRFRANIVLDAGAESLVNSVIRAGSMTANVVKRIDRCVITTRAQPGLQKDLDVLRMINRSNDSCLGVGALVTQAGRVTVGDELTAVPA